MRIAMQVPRLRVRHILALFAVVLVLVPFGATGAHAQSVGISPVRLEFRDALRGGTYVQSLNLSNTDPAAELEFTLSALGDVAPWVRFMAPGSNEPVTSVVVPRAGRVQVAVALQVPSDVANRQYEGRVEVVTKAVEQGGDSKSQGAAVGLGGFIDVAVMVTGDERRAGRVLDTAVSNAEVGMDQRFEARVQNTGNVTIQARVDVRILRDGQEVATLSTQGQNFPVFAERDDLAFVAWPTAEQRAGSYTAEFTVVDEAGVFPLELGTATVPFRLEPRGTFTRAGRFDDLKLRNAPQPGGVAQIEAVFTNTGEIDVNSVFVGELYIGDDLVRTVESRGRSARPGETVTIEVPVDVGECGDYRIVGKVDFEGSITENREVRFTAGTARNESSRTVTIVVIVAIGALLLAALELLRKYRTRRRMQRAAAARLRAYEREKAQRQLREPAGR